MASTTVSRPASRPDSRLPRRQRRARHTAAPALTFDPYILTAGVIGLLVSAYLAFVDLSGGSALCLVGSDCDIVRASAFGRVAGLPVALLGVAFFLAVLTATVVRASWHRPALQFLGGVGLGAAIVFVALQALVLAAWCPYCLVADAAALAVGVRVLWRYRGGHQSAPLMRSIAGAALAIVVLLVGFAANPTTAAGTAEAGSALGSSTGGAAATAMSQEQLTALAVHLRTSGAVFYGAYWCPHCQEQKRMFGSAADQLPYVECDPRGADAQPASCQAAGVRAYPTWVIDGRTIEGAVAPADLARLSGFGG